MTDSEFVVFEGIRSISAVINGLESGVSDRRVIEIMYDRTKEKSKSKELSFLKHKSAKHGFKITAADDIQISELANGNSHGGIIAKCTDRNIPELKENLSQIVKAGFYMMLEGIEDPYNFGYALRTMYAAGVDGVILSPRNWMNAAGVVCRSSAGASELLNMYVSDPCEAAACFKKKNYRIAAAGIRDSENAFESDLSKPLLLIVGGEKRGISRSLLDLADIIVRLDYGRKFSGSLSTASATSILAYEVFRQNRLNFPIIK